MNTKDAVMKGRFLSLVLRHRPELIDLELDSEGWVDVKDLIQKMNLHKKLINRAQLEIIVENNSKKRYAFNADRSKIRANQGHSIEVNLGLDEAQPPAILFHGTAEKFISSILKRGLIKKKRNHVHLSGDVETASKVGRRHGELVVLEINAARMFKDGLKFYRSENGVWLTESVPKEYLKMKT